jgi:hypothetical protein
MSRDPIEAATSLGYKHIATGGVSGAYWAIWFNADLNHSASATAKTRAAAIRQAADSAFAENLTMQAAVALGLQAIKGLGGLDHGSLDYLTREGQWQAEQERKAP